MYAKRVKLTIPAFTLIELLVVVAIIAVLIALLLPSLAKARDAAKAAVCGSHFQQFSLGFMQYANDNYDSLPTTGDYENHNYDPQYKQDNWINLMQHKYLVTKSNPWGYRSFKFENDVWACPSDPRVPVNGYLDGPSYGINSFVTGFYTAPYAWAPLKTSQVPEPSKTPLLMDNDNPYRAAPCFLQEDNGHYFRHSHSNGDLILFVDGHTQWIPNLDRRDLPEPICFAQNRWNYILNPIFTQEHQYWQ